MRNQHNFLSISLCIRPAVFGLLPHRPAKTLRGRAVPESRKQVFPLLFLLIPKKRQLPSGKPPPFGRIRSIAAKRIFSDNRMYRTAAGKCNPSIRTNIPIDAWRSFAPPKRGNIKPARLFLQSFCSSFNTRLHQLLLFRFDCRCDQTIFLAAGDRL